MNDETDLNAYKARIADAAATFKAAVAKRDALRLDARTAEEEAHKAYEQLELLRGALLQAAGSGESLWHLT